MQIPLVATDAVSDYIPSPGSYSSDEPATPFYNIASGSSVASNESPVSGTLDTHSWTIVTDLNPSEREFAPIQSPLRSKQLEGRKFKFQCPKCSESILKKNKKQHLSTHSLQRTRFHCSDSSCSRSFTRKHDLRRHIERDHAEYSPVESDGVRRHRRFHCDACRKSGFGDGEGGCECGYDVISTL